MTEPKPDLRWHAIFVASVVLLSMLLMACIFVALAYRLGWETGATVIQVLGAIAIVPGAAMIVSGIGAWRVDRQLVRIALRRKP